MVMSSCVRCTTCSYEYRVRFNVGHRFPQSATFFCGKCGELLTYGYEKDRKKKLINLEEISDNMQLTVINLHPELPIDPTQQSDPSYFPSINFLSKTWKEGEKGLTELRKAQRSMIIYHKNWIDLQQDYRFLIEQRWALLEGKYGKQKDKAERRILKEAIGIGRNFMEGKWDELYRNVLIEAEKAKKTTNFVHLKQYLERFKKEFLLEKMYAVMKEYQNVETELLPTLLNQKMGYSQDGLTSSVNWDKIEKIYGDFYEIYGDVLIIPTLINNTIERGDHTLFATPEFTLEKYLDTDKAGRCNNFLQNQNLKDLANFYEAGLRNATHHKASKLEASNQELVLKTGKGGMTEKRLPLLDYIISCNELYARLLVLFNITYKLAY